MTAERPILTFRSSITTPATLDAVYTVLADVNTHLVWEGEQSDDKKFKLVTLEAPAGAAAKGMTFSSTGIVPMGTFHDSSVVTDATPRQRFVFRTHSRLERKHRPALLAEFENRYTLQPEGNQTLIAYECSVWPQNYVPYWLKPGMRALCRMSVERTINKNLVRLGAMASTQRAAVAAVA
ncbi:MAG: hypothetical protein ABR498_03160 [Candidatus Dormibacteria bacterium]